MPRPAPPLTNVQRELLDVFALDVPESDLVDLRRVLARFFADRAADAMDRAVRERGLTDADVAAWAESHDRAGADRP